MGKSHFSNPFYFSDFSLPKLTKIAYSSVPRTIFEISRHGDKFNAIEARISAKVFTKRVSILGLMLDWTGQLLLKEKVLHSWSSQSNMKTFWTDLCMHNNFSPSALIWAQYLRKQFFDWKEKIELKDMSSFFRPFLSSLVGSEDDKKCSSFFNSCLIVAYHTILESSCCNLSNGANIASFDAKLRKL